jgi:TonB family protein
MRALAVIVMGLALQMAVPVIARADPLTVIIVVRLLGALEEYIESEPERELAEATARADAARQAAVAARQAAAAQPIACALPPIPPHAKAAGIQGTVQLRFLVDVDGAVIDAGVQKSSGVAELDEAGLAAIRKCKLRPLLQDGKAVQSWQAIGYSWTLD